MLLFIHVARVLIHLVMPFQYISCYCLSAGNVHGSQRSFISIHLMLLFITKAWTKGGTWSIFQYISCYCLSEQEMRIGGVARYFNTSHVTVYHPPPSIRKASLKFQYISCYCLSIPEDYKLESVYEFQYISCYCLSISDCCCTTQRNIFQYISCYCLS